MNAPSTAPTVSVVIPVRNGVGYIEACLRSLRQSDFTDYEVIVVDDASTDATVSAVEEFGVQLVRLERQSGPAVARNRGAELARGEILVFVDADVCVHPTTLRLMIETFQTHPDADAVFGSYDRDPLAFNIVSQYRNLLHHFVHQEANPRATTFWAGCGAIRRRAFTELGGFNPYYTRPRIEDIELGVRYAKAGRSIILNRNVLSTHLKRWTLMGMIKTDIRDRGIPWTRLILEQGAMPNDLNLKWSQRLSALLSVTLLAEILIGAWQYPLLILLPLFSVMTMVWADHWSVRRRVPTVARVVVPLILCGGLAAFGYYYSAWWALFILALLLGIVALNYRLYAFFARERSPLFAAIVLPLHILYFLYSGFSFGVGLAMHLGWGGPGLARVGEQMARPAPTTTVTTG